MKDLAINNGKTVFTTSEIIAQGCNVEHRAILALIKTHKLDIEDISNDAFEMRIRKGKTQKVRYYNLGEPQVTFLISLMKNSKIVVKFKKNLVKEFYKQRKLLSNLLSGDRQQVRSEGKAIYHQSRDVIKEFVEYAIEQGSKSANMYYMNLAKMENKALFVMEHKYPNVRDVLTVAQLFQVKVADQIVEKALKDGMADNMYYKDIYKLAKERIDMMAGLTDRSPVLALTK